MTPSPTNLRLCIASSGLGHVTRGIETWANDLADALHSRGERITLCKGAGDVEKAYERVVSCWTRSSVKTRALLRCVPNTVGWRIGLGGPYAVEQTTFALNLFRFLKRNAYDIVHLQDPFSALLLQRFRTLGLLQTLTVLTHGTEEPMEFQKKIDNLVHLAPWHAQQARLSHLDKSNWTMIPNFVDTSVFVPGKNPALRQEFNIPSDAFVIIVSSALKRKHKRIDFLIEEFARLRRAQPELPIWFLFAGGRERDTDALISQGKKLLGDRVRFIVSYPHARMPELLRAADLLVHGSLMEMMPMALLEALASGLPCLVHEHPVMQWMIGPGGMTLDLRSSGQLPEAIAKLVRSPQLSVELSQRARAQCEAYFSREKVVGDILRYYQVLTDRCSEQYRRSG